MSSYPPNGTHLPAEEFELSHAGPSRSPRHSPSNSFSNPPPTSTSTVHPRARRDSHKTLRRTLTLHAEDTSATLLFAAPTSGTTPRKRHVRTLSLPGSPPGTPRRPGWEHFLSDDHVPHASGAGGPGGAGGGVGYGGGREGMETVEMPDFSQMLGEDEDHFAVAAGMRSAWKKKLYLLMEEPGSGREAFFVHVLVTGGILFSAALTTFSTLPSFHTDPGSIKALFGLDTTIVLLFTFEYIARSVAHSDSWHQYYHWATSFFPLLDLIAILPYYIEVARQQDTSILFRFSILRTFRLLRVFRAFKYQNQMLLTIEVMYVAVQRSKDALVALSFFILLVLVLFSTLIYFAERGTWDATLGGFVDADGDPSQFDSIPRTAWFALVTMSTVGYGDVVPRSFLGKLLTVPLLMFGLLLIALPSFVLGRNFAIVFDAMTSQAAKAPSIVSSARASLDSPSQPISATAPSGSSAPLLPTNSHDTLPPYPSNGGGPSRIRPSPNDTPVAPTRKDPTPRMWDGPTDGPPVIPRDMVKGDLTNVKLAKNQLVLLEQIDSLRSQIERQSEVMTRLMLHLDLGNSPESANSAPATVPAALESESVSVGAVRTGLGISMSNGHPPNHGAVEDRADSKGKDPETPRAGGKVVDGDEDQFALGSSDEEGRDP